MTRRLLWSASYVAFALVAGCSTSTAPQPPDYAIPPCITNTDCTSSKSGHVCSMGTCVVCATSVDCPMGQKCDSMTACVQCLGAGDCPMGQECVNKACVQGCDGNNPCPSGKVCTADTHICVQCATNADCSGGTPVCEVAAHLCVGCLNDSDCGSGKVCLSQSCSTGCSAAHPMCGAGFVCDTNQGICVGCVSDKDCPAKQYCGGNQCLAGCRANGDCTGGQQCDTTQHACVACVDDTACTFGQVCMNAKCVAGCNPQHPCPSGDGCCNGGCVNTVSDSKNCGACGNACAAGQSCCGSVCVSNTSTANCGTCGNVCPDIVNGTRACTGGACAIGACNSGFLDCDSNISNGCELNGTADPKNCGACGNACGTPANATAPCVGGKCQLTCTGSFKDCDGKYSTGCEVDTSSDPKNCGACGNTCSSGMCTGGQCTVTSCLAILKGNPNATSGTYTIDPDAQGPMPAMQVYCDMVADGGGWTLVRVDDSTDKSVIKTAAAVDPMQSTLSCGGANVKFSDLVIKTIWTSRMRYTVKSDTTNAMTYFSDTSLSGLTSWSDQCGNNNKITWYFKQAPNVPSQAGTLNNHPEYCGWSFGPCATSTELCWYGPHNGYKVHLNPGSSHITIPPALPALGNDQGCGWGWVK